MTAPRTPMQVFKAATEVYALAQAPQVTLLRVEHPLLKQLRVYAQVLYRYSQQDEYAPFAALREVTGWLFDFVHLAGATLLPLNAPLLWDTTREPAITRLAERLSHQGHTHLAAYLKAAHAAVSRLRSYGGAPLAESIGAYLREQRRSTSTPPGASGGWRQRRVAVVIAQRACKEHVEQALQAHSAEIYVTTSPALQDLVMFDAMVAVGFSSEFPPSLFTAPRAPTLLLAQYAVSSEPAAFGGLYSASSVPLGVDVMEQCVPASDALRALRLPALRDSDVRPRVVTAALTAAQRERAGEQDQQRDDKHARMLEQLAEDLAFVNDQAGPTPADQSAARTRAALYDVAPGAWSAPTWEANAAATITQLSSGTPDAPDASRTALLVELDGGQQNSVYAYVDSQARRCAVVQAGTLAQVLYVPARQLGAGDYLLLRTQGGAQRAREMAAAAGGTRYAQDRALRDEWRGKLQRLVNLNGEQSVLHLINRSDVLHGRVKVPITSLRRWLRDDTTLRPDDDAEFEALLEAVRIPVYGPDSRFQEFKEAMSRLRGTHVSAGHHVSDDLLSQAVNGADASALIERGYQTFTLGDGSGAFTAYRVLRIGDERHVVHPTLLARPFSQEAS